MPELTYDNGLNDGFMQGLAKAQQLIAQALADGLPQPVVDEPTRSIEWPHDHDLKPLDETA